MKKTALAALLILILVFVPGMAVSAGSPHRILSLEPENIDLSYTASSFGLFYAGNILLAKVPSLHKRYHVNAMLTSTLDVDAAAGLTIATLNKDLGGLDIDVMASLSRYGFGIRRLLTQNIGIGLGIVSPFKSTGFEFTAFLSVKL